MSISINQSIFFSRKSDEHSKTIAIERRGRAVRLK